MATNGRSICITHRSGWVSRYSPYDTHMEPNVNTRDGRKRFDLRGLGIEILTITDGISDEDFSRQVLAILGPPEEFPRLEMAR